MRLYLDISGCRANCLNQDLELVALERRRGNGQGSE